MTKSQDRLGRMVAPRIIAAACFGLGLGLSLAVLLSVGGGTTTGALFWSLAWNLIGWLAYCVARRNSRRFVVNIRLREEQR